MTGHRPIDQDVATASRGMGVAHASYMRTKSVMTLLLLLIAGPASAEIPRLQSDNPLVAWTPPPDASAPPDEGPVPPVENAPPPAPTPPTAPAPSQPPASSSTTIAGRVTDVRGRPVVNMRVYVTPARGQTLRTRTDTDGRYAVTVAAPGRYGVVIAIGKAHTFRSVDARSDETTTLDIDIDLDIDGGEVIQIDSERRPKPAIMAKPKQDQQLTLPYSAEAVKRDAWARAWLLLDIDETGTVKRLKLLKRPGFALEKICLDAAFRLTFEPGRDSDGRPMKTYVLWSMEWPSWGWLVQGTGTVVRRPVESNQLHVLTPNLTHRVFSRDYGGGKGGVRSGGLAAQPLAISSAFPHTLSQVPCFGSAPLNLDLRNRTQRDCALPDLAEAVALPWITAETASTAIAEMAADPIQLARERPRGPRWPAFAGFSVTGALGVATVVSYLRFKKHHAQLTELTHLNSIEKVGSTYETVLDRRQRWQSLSILSVVSTAAAGGVSLWLWNRRHAASFSVAPNLGGYGGRASFEMTW